MSRIVSLFALLLSALFSSAQAPAYEITITLKPFQNQYIYLGYYYGKQRPIVDSVKLDRKSTGVFKGNKKLDQGLYLIGYPDKSGYFEVMVGPDQTFSVITDTANLVNTIRFVNSPENERFNTYQQFTNIKGQLIDKTRAELAVAKNKADSTRLTGILNQTNTEIQDYRLKYVKDHPKDLLTLLFHVMKEPTVPPAEKHPGGKYDSTYAFQYYKQHYWDDVYFFDDRVVRTPVFEPKLDKYFEQLVYPNPDSVINEMEWMLGFASANAEMQKFLLVKFVNRYLNQRYMWEDKVFVHLFEKYFSQKNYSWLTERGKKTIFDRAYSLMANLLGSPAPGVELPDSAGKIKMLQDIKSAYTVVVFWDPTCGHCKETLPRIDSIYQAKWKKSGVAIYAIARETDGTPKDWRDFINQHRLGEWTHVYNSKQEESNRVSSGIPGYAQLFDIQTVPTLYLLDKDKRILAKKIPLEQIDEVLAFKLKGQ